MQYEESVLFPEDVFVYDVRAQDISSQGVVFAYKKYPWGVKFGNNVGEIIDWILVIHFVDRHGRMLYKVEVSPDHQYFSLWDNIQEVVNRNGRFVRQGYILKYYNTRLPFSSRDGPSSRLIPAPVPVYIESFE
tara:strand:+ start:151 stop:549 length:399 start_codon:yes stop_codon:yes gene_type:complete